MEYYTILISVAAIVLLIILVYVGIQMSNSASTSAVWPPAQASCPDYWTLDSNGKCVAGTQNLGTYSTGFSFDPKSPPVNSATTNINNSSLTCLQQLWSNQHGNIVWSGVTEHNQC
jgi:hypothetical protein